MSKLVLGSDLDGTISVAPKLFKKLFKAVRDAGGEVHVVTSIHTPEATPQDYAYKKALLEQLDIPYDDLYIAVPPIAENKAKYCKTVSMDFFVDDRYRNTIDVTQVCPTGLFCTPDDTVPSDADT